MCLQQQMLAFEHLYHYVIQFLLDKYGESDRFLKDEVEAITEDTEYKI